MVRRVRMYPSPYVMIFSSQRLLPGIPCIIPGNTAAGFDHQMIDDNERGAG